MVVGIWGGFLSGRAGDGSELVGEEEGLIKTGDWVYGVDLAPGRRHIMLELGPGTSRIFH